MSNDVRPSGARARHRRSIGTAPWWHRGVNVARGALIGTVEAVPGVSGGTVALVVGVYETVITSAGHLLSGIRTFLADLLRRRPLGRSRVEFAKVDWQVMIPLLIGMFAALVAMARLIEGWVEDSPVESRALFFGLVLASLWVPFSLAGRASREPGPASGVQRRSKGHWSLGDVSVALAAAAVAFVVVSLPPGDVDPDRPVVMIAAAIAVSALVLPGLSGSFLLLTFGLYEDTLSAVNERDFGYLAFFALGAAIGLASFVKLLQWLLEHHRRLTLVVLTGVMAGCLRALWPWQDADRGLATPGADLGAAVGLASLGFLVVLAFVLVDRRWVARRAV